jgi:hypothetical protein
LHALQTAINISHPVVAPMVAAVDTRVHVRHRLYPLFDQLCTLYENKNARHRNMPTLDNVFNAINDTIQNVHQFFDKLEKKKRRKLSHQQI